MQYIETLDLRQMADEWRGIVDEVQLLLDEDAPPLTDADTERLDELQEESRKYEALCRELGVDQDPDALAHFGDSYEPTLIRETDFAEYARELAEEIAPSREAADLLTQWPYNCIDWDYAAKELAYDYNTVTFDGVDYKIRSW
jgi:hypothetical protein